MPTPGRGFWYACGTLAALLLATELLFLPLPGIQQDEALFIRPFLRGEPSLYSFSIGKIHVPVMLMDYIGCLKTWLYGPVMLFWRPSVWSIRLPVCLIGAVTVLLFAGLAKRVTNPAVAFCAALLLATDASFVLTNVFDWGPVALLILGTVAVLALLVHFASSGRGLALAAACLVAGLMTWYKAVFVFPAAGLLVACVAVYPRQVRRSLSASNVMLAAAAFLIGSGPLILFNLSRHGATVAATSYVARVPATEKLTMLGLTLDGKALEHYMFRSTPDEVLRLSGAPLGELVMSWYRQPSELGPGGFLLAAVLLSACALPAIRASRWFRPILFAWAAGLATVALFLVSPGAGGGQHHSVLVYPAPQFIVAATIAALTERRRWGLACAIGVIVVSNCVLLANYHRLGVKNGFSVFWTDATRPLGAVLRERRQPVAFLDWGIEAAARIESGDAIVIAPPDPPRPDVLYVTRPDRYLVNGALTREVRDGARGRGLAIVAESTIPDSHGVPMLAVFRLQNR